MIITKKGLRYIKLVNVSNDNENNKIYTMEELPDGRIKCESGNVGKHASVQYKNGKKWYSIVKQKEAKGFVDVTELLIKPLNVAVQSDKDLIDSIEDPEVREVIQRLFYFDNHDDKSDAKKNRMKSQEHRVNAIQEILSTVVNISATGLNTEELDILLLKLSNVISVASGKIKSYLLGRISDSETFNKLLNFLSNNPSLKDSTVTKVDLSKNKGVENSVELKYNMLDRMGISMEVVEDEKIINMVKKQLAHRSKYLNKVYAVTNYRTQAKFDENLKNAKNKTTELLYHGSRNCNWFNILQTGLYIKHLGAVHVGNMYGNGIYFAADGEKAMGYCDGARWTGGERPEYTYIGLFETHTGRPYHYYRYHRSVHHVSQKLKQKGYDSIYAHKGVSLRRDEKVIYHDSQCTIKYLVEFKNN